MIFRELTNRRLLQYNGAVKSRRALSGAKAAERDDCSVTKKSLALCLLCLLCCLMCAFSLAEDAMDTPADDPAAAEEAPAVQQSARDAFIDGIIETGRQLYVKANGKLQRAQYAGDIYVCKNFTVHVFRENCARFRMAEYPGVALKIPNNLPKEKCKPHSYGYCWEEVTAAEGNPFYIAAQFLYDASLSKQENMEKALEFMRQVRRGDYFQMSAEYYYGVGAHSAIMIADYDPETDTVHWMDSNMAGEKRDGVRYGKVQFDAVKEISWWAEAFCKKTRGATIYRLRDDIIFAEQF